jgi:hypothetical protein
MVIAAQGFQPTPAGRVPPRTGRDFGRDRCRPATDESGMSPVEYSIVSVYTHYWPDPILVRAYRDIKY